MHFSRICPVPFILARPIVDIFGPDGMERSMAFRALTRQILENYLEQEFVPPQNSQQKHGQYIRS